MLSKHCSIVCFFQLSYCLLVVKQYCVELCRFSTAYFFVCKVLAVQKAEQQFLFILSLMRPGLVPLARVRPFQQEQHICDSWAATPGTMLSRSRSSWHSQTEQRFKALFWPGSWFKKKRVCQHVWLCISRSLTAQIVFVRCCWLRAKIKDDTTTVCSLKN